VPWLSKNQMYDFLKPLIASKNIRVQVFQKELESLLEDVQNDRLDIILCDSPYSGRSKKLQVHQLSTDTIVCVASTKEAFKGNFPQCIEGKKIISYSESSIMADKIDDFFKVNKLNVNVVGEFTDSSLMRVTIEKGGLAGFLPYSVAKEGLESKTLIKLGDLEQLKFSLWAITRKNYKQDSLMETLFKNYKDNHCNE